MCDLYLILMIAGAARAAQALHYLSSNHLEIQKTSWLGASGYGTLTTLVSNLRASNIWNPSASETDCPAAFA